MVRKTERRAAIRDEGLRPLAHNRFLLFEIFIVSTLAFQNLIVAEGFEQGKFISLM